MDVWVWSVCLPLCCDRPGSSCDVVMVVVVVVVSCGCVGVVSVCRCPGSSCDVLVVVVVVVFVVVSCGCGQCLPLSWIVL